MNGVRSAVSLVALTCALSGCAYFRGPADADEEAEQIPLACTPEFAADFEPLQVTDGTVSSMAFSADCSRLLTLAGADQSLRVTDLEARSTVTVDTEVSWAAFTEAGHRVLYQRATDLSGTLHVAEDDEVYAIDEQVAAPSSAPDGSAVAYLVDVDMSTHVGELWLASLDPLPPSPVLLADAAFGSPIWTPDGSRILYMANPQTQTQETAWGACSWTTADIFVTPLDGPSTLLLEGASSYAVRVSADGERVYASVDYDCAENTQTLVSVSFGGDDPLPLVTHEALLFGFDFTEVPSLEKIVHPMLFTPQQSPDYEYELWATQVDGERSAMVAPDLMSNLETCAYFVPFEVIPDETVLYLRRDSADLGAVDLVSGASWTVASAALGLYFDVSPDGTSVLTLQEREGTIALLDTPISGEPGDVLMEGMDASDRPIWNAGGERVLVLLTRDAGTSRTLYSLSPAELESRVVTNGLASWTWALHPGGWLAAVQVAEGVQVVPIP